MAWTTPKTWTVENIDYTHLNDIEGNVVFLQALNPNDIKYKYFTGNTFGSSTSIATGIDPTKIVGMWGLFYTASNGYYMPFGSSYDAGLNKYTTDLAVSATGNLEFKNQIQSAGNFKVTIAYTD
jgi:hypothetical protein